MIVFGSGAHAKEIFYSGGVEEWDFSVSPLILINFNF